jgi:hypothetical protein
MARKRKKTTSRKYSRRRRGGLGSINAGNMVMQLGGVIAGVAAAGYLNKLVLKNQSENIQSLAPIAAGIAMPLILKSEFGKNLGAGMVAYGGAKFLQKAGLGAMDDADIMISGDDLSVIAGDDEFAIAGDDEFAIAGDDEFAIAGDDISVLS